MHLALEHTQVQGTDRVSLAKTNFKVSARMTVDGGVAVKTSFMIKTNPFKIHPGETGTTTKDAS